MKFRVYRAWGLGLGFRAWGLGFRAWGLGLRAWDLGESSGAVVIRMSTVLSSRTTPNEALNLTNSLKRLRIKSSVEGLGLMSLGLRA